MDLQSNSRGEHPSQMSMDQDQISQVFSTESQILKQKSMKQRKKATYHLQSEAMKTNNKILTQTNQNSEDDMPKFDQSLSDQELDQIINSEMLKSNNNGGYYETQQRIKKIKGEIQGYFEDVIVADIKKADYISQNRKQEITQLYRALCIFSTANVLFYKRLRKHERAFSLKHEQPTKNLYQENQDRLPRLKQLMVGHLQVGAGIQNIRRFYNTKNIIKDQYSTLLHALLRVVFSKVRDYIILKYPKLEWMLTTTKGGTARFAYSNAVSIALLHAEKQFSPSMYACFVKIVYVVYYIGKIQDITMSDVQALFEMLRERNQQHLVPLKMDEQKSATQQQSRKFSPNWKGYIPYVPFAEPQCDVDHQVVEPKGEQIFQICENYKTRNWAHKFQKYVMTLFLQHQNFLDMKQIINQKYHHFLGRELDLEQLRCKFQCAMKKIIIYLQIELYYIIRRTNVNKISNYKVEYATKKFLTLNKNQKRAIFTSQNSKNCRMFLIDYYLNNFQRKSKSYKMSCINYRLSYLDMTIKAIMMFLHTKIGECGILLESQLEKQDTYPLKLISNAYWSIIKSILKQILLFKALKYNDLKQKLVKNPNTQRALCTPGEVQSLFQELKPDDLMEIQLIYLVHRNRSLIVKRNPKKFEHFKITKTLQQGLVQEEWQNLLQIISRVKTDKEDDLDNEIHGNQKFEIMNQIDIENEENLQMNQLKNNRKTVKTDGAASSKKSNLDQSMSRNNINSFHGQADSMQSIMHQEQQSLKNREFEEFMRALKESQWVKTQVLIMKVNEGKDNFRKYFK